MASFRQTGVPDEAVIATNDEATCSKRFAVSLGYWSDPYINLFGKHNTRKTPEISRGYFARVFAVRSLVEQFIRTHEFHCQVISLGAGYDTMFWNLKDSAHLPDRYIEVDFNSVTRQKTAIIHAKKDQLLASLGENVDILDAKLGLRSSHYTLLPADLRDTNSLNLQFKSVDVDFSLPTLFLTECVLMYISHEESDQFLSSLSQTFKDAHFINYDMTNMSDKFAEVMLTNLSTRQCSLHVQDCQTNQMQLERFKRCGWLNCVVCDMNDIYRSIPASERSRIERIEMLDEVHLLTELMMHYCICIASNTENNVLSLDNLNTSIGKLHKP